MYKKIDVNDIKFLKSIKGIIVETKDEINSQYYHDELGTVEHAPDLHIYVFSKQQISKIMTYANQENICVTVRGAGTGLVGASVAIHGGILLDMSKMNKIIELDKTNLTLTVEPGVLLKDIYACVEAEGLFYAPDPGQKLATIGGNISTNAGGMRAIKYGVTRDWVRGLEVVLPNGSIEKFGRKVVKNSTGYALKDLMIGSEGTLAIIVEATLKLIPKPKFQKSLLIPFKKVDDAIKAAPQIIVNHVLPTAVEYLEKQSLQYSEAFLGKKIEHNEFEAYLLLSYDAHTKDALNDDISKAKHLFLNDYHALDVFDVDTSKKRSDVWNVRDGFLEAIKASSDTIDECDVVLPRSHIYEFLSFVNDQSKALDLRIPYFGHVGDGNLHIYFCKDHMNEDIWNEKIQEGFKRLYDKAASLGGLISGEHGIGYAKKLYMKRLLGEQQIQLMKGIKGVFDPKGILNPSKII